MTSTVTEVAKKSVFLEIPIVSDGTPKVKVKKESAKKTPRLGDFDFPPETKLNFISKGRTDRDAALIPQLFSVSEKVPKVITTFKNKLKERTIFRGGKVKVRVFTGVCVSGEAGVAFFGTKGTAIFPIVSGASGVAIDRAVKESGVIAVPFTREVLITIGASEKSTFRGSGLATIGIDFKAGEIFLSTRGLVTTTREKDSVKMRVSETEHSIRERKAIPKT